LAKFPFSEPPAIRNETKTEGISMKSSGLPEWRIAITIMEIGAVAGEKEEFGHPITAAGQFYGWNKNAGPTLSMMDE
jgi:hypothetical protein